MIEQDMLALAREIADEARGQAMAYAWGRQDAGEGRHDTDASIEFADHYAGMALDYRMELRGSLPNLRDAYEKWTKTRS